MKMLPGTLFFVKVPEHFKVIPHQRLIKFIEVIYLTGKKKEGYWIPRIIVSYNHIG